MKKNNLMSLIGGIVAIAVIVLTTAGCANAASGSSLVGEEKVTLLTGKKSDSVTFEEVGNSLVFYFSAGSLKVSESVSEFSDYASELLINSTAVSSEATVTVSKNGRFVYGEYTDSSRKKEFFKLEILANKNSFKGFVAPTDLDTGDSVEKVVVRKNGNVLFLKANAGVSIRYTFADTTSSSAFASGTTGTAVSGASARIDIPEGSGKNLLLSIWEDGEDPSADPVSSYAYYEVGSGVATVKVPTAWINGTNIPTGAYQAMSIGDTVEYVVSAANATGLYAMVSATSSTPADKSVAPYRQETPVNGELRLRVTYTGGAGYLLCWSKGVDGTYSSCHTLTLSEKVSTPTDIRVSSVSLNKTNLILNVGGADQLLATVLPTNATNVGVNWSSNNPSVATVTSTGAVTALSAGTAVITVTTIDGAKSASCVVTVQQQQATTGGTTSQKYLYMDSSWSGSTVQITNEVNGNISNVVVGVDGKLNIDIPFGTKFSVSLITPDQQYCDAAGMPGCWSQSESWNENEVTLVSFQNGGMISTGRTVRWQYR